MTGAVMRTRLVRLSIIALLLAGGVTAAAGFALRGTSDLPKALRGIVLAAPIALDPVTLLSRGGEVSLPVAREGRWTLLTLGFTHCPDVCPFILGNLATVERRLKEALPDGVVPQVVFLSVDPDRDRPSHLADYVDYFSPGFLGLTGPRATIDRLVAQLGAFYRYGPQDASGAYTVTHSAEVYLLDPSGRLFARFAPPIDPDRMVGDFPRILSLHRETATLRGGERS